MSQIVNGLRLVVLQSPYEAWDNPQVPQTFSDMIKLKRLGYGRNYPTGVLPIDTTDLIATHVLVYDESQPKNPCVLMGYKSTSLNTSARYNLVFPGLGLVRAAGAATHVKAMESIIASCQASGRDLAYLGSWTVDPDLKKRRLGLQKALKEIFIASYCLLYEEQNISEVVIGGTLRFRTEKVFSDLGHHPLSWQGHELSPIHVTHLVGEKVQVMHAQKFNESLRPIVNRWKPLWDSRLVLSAGPALATKKAG